MDVKHQYIEQFAGQETLHTLIKTIDISSDNDLNQGLLESTKIRRAEILDAVTYIRENFGAKYQNQIDTAFLKLVNIKKGNLSTNLSPLSK